MSLQYHRQLESIHVNTMEPRAYFIPFAMPECKGKAREESDRFQLLNGEWDFRFIPDVERVGIAKEGFADKIACEETVTVPKCWQMYTDRNYDAPQYINQDYPFPVDPPHLPDAIPGGFYRHTFTAKKNTDKRYWLNFEGVSPCFYLWLNDRFVGFGSVSHSTNEFDVTDYLTDGDNKIEVLVVKYCVGTYLEDQDFFRLSGIFRDVYILERDEACIRDIFIRPQVTEDLQSAVVSVDVDMTQQVAFAWSLRDPDGAPTDIHGFENGSFSFEIEKPILWNPEQPKQYELFVTCGTECISFMIAVRRFEIKNKTVLLNGVKVKAKGVNRHDNHPETGYAVTVDEMLRDLYLLKRANVNTIRTSHYPNDPRFMEMCERLGFMMVDEADLETHGMGYNYGDWYWDYWAFLCDDPAWRDICVDRAKRLFERDKNRGCVVLWSLGNESGCGENHRHMASYIRARDERALIHYENAHLEYQARLNKDFTDISDVESRMYASIEYLANYLADPESKKPFFYCEYVDSMSTGDVYKHWDGFEDNDLYFGACIWEFSDHAVNIGTVDNPKYRYGGDWGEEPNDFICCIDGLVYPDRRLRPGYYDMKKVYEPFAVTYENGTICIKNKRYYSVSDDCYAEWTIKTDGKTVLSGRLDDLSLQPQEQKKFVLFDVADFDGNTTLNLSFRQKQDTEWADANYEVAFFQTVLCECAEFSVCSAKEHVQIAELPYEYVLSAGETVYRIDRLTGLMTAIEKGGKQILTQAMEIPVYTCWRYNTRGNDEVWGRARYDRLRKKCYATKLIKNEDGSVSVVADLSLAAAAMPPALKMQLTYTVSADGACRTQADVNVTHNAPALPQFGFEWRLPKEYEKVSYYGYGPHESYAERWQSTRIDLYNTTVTDLYEPYIAPQESSARYGTKYASVSACENERIFFAAIEPSFGFSFKALHYTNEDLRKTKHHDELIERDETVVSTLYKIDYPAVPFDDKQFRFAVVIKP